MRQITSLLIASALFGGAVIACGSSSGNSSTADDSAVTKTCGASTTGPVQGADVSYYQGDFNWASANVTFGYARISDGVSFPDPKFDANWTNMKSAGLLRGGYQFFRPNEDVNAQAQMVVTKLGMLGAGDLPAMIDIEVTAANSPTSMASKIKQWLDIVEAGTGKTPLIYTGSYFWQDNVQDTTFGRYPVWIAAYGPSCPSLPAGWSNWAIWQYTDSNNKLDKDVFNGSLDDLTALAGVPSTPPPNSDDAGTQGPTDPDAGPPPGDPQDDCYSQTLSQYMPLDSCVYSAADGVEEQCVDGTWYEGVTDGVGPDGPCISEN